MYQLKTKFSRFETEPKGGGQWLHLSLKSPVDGASISVVAGHKAPDPFFASGSFLMFPWVNRLEPNPWARDPFYPSVHWLTDGNGIPLHGLFHNLPRTVLTESEGELESFVSFSIEIPETWEGTLLSKIKVKETYQLFPSELKIIYELNNTSDGEFPFALGIHPYFRWNEEESIDDLFLIGSGFYQIKLGDYLLPERVLGEELLLYGEIPLAGKNLDDLYVSKETEKPYIGLFSMNKKEKLLITGGNFYQVYTPLDRRSIAIEPMTSTGNFLHFPGANPNLLAPHSEKKIEFSIRLDQF
ncbi:aldose 1-epimerase [Leptospira bouyouniensis]|uniref:Aldose 1-epimerase n=1 Tax=Leptospira bouyouniensis TaxID=2484911 RepID=A0A7I0HN80_9LEPT|nr:aldose 1-epimerase [Leptospira bouyouniensis]TGK46915.1 aldose 1-epimerase [Leptospira bouyouniensis]TGL03090.1 aldose 1-epimerase [Leptospira bouyouniensis]